MKTARSIVTVVLGASILAPVSFANRARVDEKDVSAKAAAVEISVPSRAAGEMALTKGAGAAAQNAIGTAVTGGLLSATFIDLIFIPFFFVLVSRLFARKPRPAAAPAPAVNSPEVN